MLLINSWLLFPLLAVAICVGLGLGVQKVCGIRLPMTVLPAVGLATLTVIVSPFYTAGLGATVPLAVTVVVAIAGYLFARGGALTAKPPWWQIGAGLTAYLVYAAPVLLSGQATFAGYNLLNDTSIHFVLMDQLANHGAHLSNLAPSSYGSAVNAYLSAAYPLGPHEALATLKAILPIDVAYLYQAFLSLVMACTAMAAAVLLSRARLPDRYAAILGLAASLAYLPFAYAMQGSIKELAMIMLLMSGAALAAELLAREDRPGFRPRSAVPLAIVSSAMIATYNVGALPWLAPLLGIVIAVLAAQNSASARQWSRIAFVLVGGTAILSIPALLKTPKFLTASQGIVNSNLELGNLISPLRQIEGFGVWLSGDFRIPNPGHPTLTYFLIATFAALALAGLYWCLRRRTPAPLLYAVPAILAYILISAQSSSPWVEAKALTILSPTAILLAAGAVALARRVSALLAATCVMLLLGGVVASDLLVYRVVRLAPAARFSEQTDINHRSRGRGPTLLNEFDEYAKHFLRDSAVNNPYEAWTPAQAKPNRPVRSVFARYFDLDELDLAYVEQYPRIVTRRSPAASRPPSNYRAVFEGRYYTMWEKQARPAPTAHLPLGDRYTPFGRPACKQVLRMARSASKMGAHLVGPVGAPNIVLSAGELTLPDGWMKSAARSAAAIVIQGPGKLSMAFTAGQGLYSAWIVGSVTDQVRVRIDGGPARSSTQLQGPGQYAELGSDGLTRGTHTLELARSSGSLAPGGDLAQRFDAVTLQPSYPTHMIEVEPHQARQLCKKELDWVELVT